MNDFFLDEQAKMLYAKNKNGYYEPFAVEYDKKTGNCRVIAQDPILMELYEFVNYFQRVRDNKGNWRSNPIFPYQWSFLFRHAIELLNGDGNQLLEAYSRQLGKSFAIKLLMAWELVFLPRYIDVKLERYTAILCSHKKESVEKLFAECKTAIYKAIELYNKKYKDKLITKNGELNNPKLIETSIIIEINKQFVDGDEIPYSKSTALTMQTSNDGLSAYHIIVDESGLCEYERFETSVAPFTASVNGMTTYIGVPNEDSSNLLHRKFVDPTVKKTIYDCELGYEMRKMVDKDFAEKYRRHLDNVFASNGKNSAFVQWNYFMNFMDMNGKFCTREVLESLNIMTESVATDNEIRNDYNNTNVYNVAGLDISPKRDYRVLTIMKTFIVNGEISENVEFDKITFNKDKTRMEHEMTAQLVADNLKRCKIDFICIDATAQGWYFVQTLRKKIKEIGINTLIVPYSYNGATKAKLFGFLEDMLFSGKLKLLKENASWESAKTIEEMLYMIKEKSKGDSETIKYYAPQSADFTDDHMNSLALCNIAWRACYEAHKARTYADDGAVKWRIKLNKFRILEERNAESLRPAGLAFWDVPI